MKKIINVAEPQKGKSIYTLQETKNYLEFSNINLVFEYNMVVLDLWQKAKQFNYSCEIIDKKKLKMYRSDLLAEQVPEIPVMMIGIMDVHRASYLEGYLVWMKENNLPVRIITDEYDVHQIGYNTDRMQISRDNWIQMVINNVYAAIFEFNSATNINGLITDIIWDEVNVMPGYEGYCGWDSLQIQTLPDSHFHDLLNGEVTAELRRKLNRAWDSRENILINCSAFTLDHARIIETMSNTDYSANTKIINYTTEDKINDIPEENTCIIGGKTFGRSVSIPNLTSMVYYRKQTPCVANTLQAVGRLLGNRRSDPLLITTESLKSAILQGIDLENAIVESGILLDIPEARVQWFTERVSKYNETIKIFSTKANGFTESNYPSWQIVDKEDTEGLQKAEQYFEFEMPKHLWENWENKDMARTVNVEMWKFVLDKFPFLADVKGIREEADGESAAFRTRIAIKEYLENGYRKYVHSKSNRRNLPIKYGRQPNISYMGFLIVRDMDVEYGPNTYHHNEYGERIKQVPKFISRN